MGATARLEIRIDPSDKILVERAAELTHQSVTAFATSVLVARARALVEGGASLSGARPIGGWSFELPAGWDEPLDDLAGYR